MFLTILTYVLTCFCRKFSRFFKISDSLGFDQSNQFKKKNLVLRLKLSGCLDSSWSVGSIFKWFSIPVSIPLDWSKLFFFFFLNKKTKTYRNQITCSLVFLSSFSIPLLIPSYLKFFGLFLSQSFKGFLPHHKVRLFYPFFLFKLHAFMHFS